MHLTAHDRPLACEQPGKVVRLNSFVSFAYAFEDGFPSRAAGWNRARSLAFWCDTDCQTSHVTSEQDELFWNIFWYFTSRGHSYGM